MALWGASAAPQAARTVTGTVTDESDRPLVGATIVVAGTVQGTTTDSEGKFTIRIPESRDRIDVSFVGYLARTVTLGTRTHVDIQLTEAANPIDEVIAIGYGSKTKANATGAVQNLSVTDAAMRAVSSTDMLLQGKAAGIQMIQNSGQPGADALEIRIRGISSIDNNSSPLVIVDGVESDINRVNPRDIKSVSVLKDASSAAIYGNRAAAGVIIIETRTGRKGIEINYSGSVSAHFATRLPELVDDPVQYIDLANEAFLNTGLKPKYTEATRQQWIDREMKTRQPVDWKKLLFETGMMQTHYVNVSGAGERYDFSFSTGYRDQDGVVFSTRADKLDYRLKMNVLFFDKKLKIGALVSGYETSSHEAQAANTIINRYVANRPILHFKSTEGGRNIYGAGAAFYAIEELGGGNDRRYSDLNSTFTATLTPVKGLTLKALYNQRNSRIRLTKYIPSYEQSANAEVTTGTLKRSELTERADWNKRRTFNATAGYKGRFGRHDIDLLVGYEMRETCSDWNQVKVMDLKKNAPLISYGDPNTLTVAASASEYAAISLFGRLSYEFDNRYLVELNLGRDGSSRFARGRRFGWFPSAAAAWRVSQERFLKEVAWIDNLKLRASYGRLGNDNIGSAYTFTDRMSSQEYYSFGGTQVDGSAITLLSNPFTSWETVEQANIGLDFDFLNAFSFSADIFRKDVSDMLGRLYPVVSLGTGTNGAPQNVGRMRNRGIEVSLSYTKRFRNKLRLTVGGNLAWVENKVIDLGSNRDQWHTTDGSVRSEVGYPMQSLYGYRCIGLYQVDDFTWQNDSDPAIPHMERRYALKPGRTTTTLHANPRPGDLLLKDRDGDNEITTDDIVRLGRGRSDLTFAFNIGVNWKNFDFQLLAQGQGRALAYLQNSAPATTAFTGQIFRSFVRERWTEQTPHYRALHADKQRLAIISSYDMHNAAYLRLKNIQLGYTFTGAWLRKIRLRDLRIYVTGENLLTFTSFPKDFDPERAVDNHTVGAYPLIKSISGGLSVTF